MNGAERAPVLPVSVSVTCCIDERAHEVPDTELAAAASRSNGNYQALCGHMISAASLMVPDGEPCGLCLAIRDQRVPGTRRTRWRHLLRQRR